MPQSSVELTMLKSDPMMNGVEYSSTIQYEVDQDGILEYNVGIPLTDSLPILNSETIDLHLCDLSRQTEIKSGQRGPPERTPYAGQYDFHVGINSSHTHKKKYVVSHKLNRIYVDMDMDFPIQFSWRGPPHMFVRATCAFADDAQAEKRVERCLSHFHSSSYSDHTVSRNVLHSSRPPGTAGIQYCGDPDSADSWLSVLVALHKPGSEVSHAYRFTCKNSCASGINRRSILIIFTLEDNMGTVFGRQIVGARVCACPRRDMVKDEETEGVPRTKKRKLTTTVPSQPPTPQPTKVKREDVEDAIIDLNLQLTSPAAAILGLEVMIKMEQQANDSRREPRASDVIAQLKKLQDELKEKYPQQN